MEEKFPTGVPKKKNPYSWSGGEIEEDDLLALKRELDILDYVDSGFYKEKAGENGTVYFFDEKGEKIFETSDDDIQELRKAQAERNKRRLLRPQDDRDASATSH